MTNNEIIKALEWCHTAANHIGSATLSKEQISAVFDLINSYEAEIERLKKTPKCMYAYDGETMEYCVEGPCSIEMAIETAKAEAIKEFAERLKERKYQSSDWSHGEHPFVVEVDDIDNLVEEMVGEGK